MSHTVSILPPVLRQLSCICLFALFLERVYCAGSVVVNATDPRIQYTPPLDDVDAWVVIEDGTVDITRTGNADATASFNFTGTYFVLNSITSDNDFTAAVDIIFDGSVSTVTGRPVFNNSNAIFSLNDLDPSVQHNVSVRMSQTQAKGNGTVWNILFVEYNPPTPTQKTSKIGTIVGASIGACIGIGAVCILSICLHRRQKRKRRDDMLTAEPITTGRSEPRSQLMAEIRSRAEHKRLKRAEQAEVTVMKLGDYPSDWSPLLEKSITDLPDTARSHIFRDGFPSPLVDLDTQSRSCGSSPRETLVYPPSARHSMLSSPGMVAVGTTARYSSSSSQTFVQQRIA